MFEAVIFDFDGVIMDSEPIHYQAFCEVFGKIGLDLSYAEYAEKYIGLSDKEIFPKLLESRGFNFADNEIDSLLTKKIATYTDIIKASDHLPMIAGLYEFMKKIAASGKKMAICTGSSRDEVMAVLSKTHQGTLPSFFTSIVTFEDVQFGKPSPEGYLLTAKRLNIPPEKCLVIEDSPHGIEAATQSGMYVTALLTTHAREQLQKAHKIVHNFAEVLSANAQELLSMP